MESQKMESQKMESQKMESQELTINFESGTTPEEMAAFAETIREKLKGKVKEEDIEDIVKAYLENLKNARILCDSCRNDITEEERKSLIVYTFSCKRCNLKYDLCGSCQQDELLSLCPENFGCNKESNDNIFIMKPSNNNKEDSKEQKTYEIFGGRYFPTHGEIIETNFSEFLDEMQMCQHFEISLIHIKQKVVPYEFIRDLWFHFRTVNPRCLEKYGEPKTRLDELPNLTMYKAYESFTKPFELFISCDCDDSPLILSLIYPNGDIFFIRKLPENLRRQGVPFGTFLIPFSEDIKKGKMNSMYKIGASLKKELEERTGSTIEKLSKEGEILQLSVGFKEKKEEEYRE